MRTKQQMMELILGIAGQDERVRLVSMEGSRTNVNIPEDRFQDYDVTYFVTDMEPYLADDSWLARFGRIIMMQKPEDMALFPPSETGFSCLMTFDDYNKIDLTLLPLDGLDDYLGRDKLIRILVDKDGRIDHDMIPSDEDYHVKRPSAREFDDCCNEFWHVTPYVVKGLARREILFANDHSQILRRELLRMMAWKVGVDTGFSLSVGKNHKFIDRYIPGDWWDRLLQTYRQDSYENAWQSLFICLGLFREVSAEVASLLGFVYPDYDRNITRLVEDTYMEEQA